MTHTPDGCQVRHPAPATARAHAYAHGQMTPEQVALSSAIIQACDIIEGTPDTAA